MSDEQKRSFQKDIYDTIISLDSIIGALLGIASSAAGFANQWLWVVVIVIAAIVFSVIRSGGKNIKPVGVAIIALIIGAILSALVLNALVSRQIKVVGRIVDTNGGSCVNHAFILRDGEGITREFTTDNEGRFFVRNVPSGLFSIYDKITIQFVAGGEIPEGLSRVGTQEINIQEHSFHLCAGTLPPTPTSTPSSATPIASDTPQPSATPIPTNTLSPSPEPPDTPQPSATPIPTNTPELILIYEEDFEDSGSMLRFTQNWDRRQGSVNVVSDGDSNLVLQSQGTMEYILLPSVDWENYFVELDVQIIEWGDDANLLFVVRSDDPTCSGYNQTVNGTIMLISHGDSNCNSISEWSTRLNPMSTEQWYKFQIEILGDIIRFRIDDRPWYIANDYPYQRRIFGIVSLNIRELEIDNIRVWSLDD